MVDELFSFYGFFQICCFCALVKFLYSKVHSYFLPFLKDGFFQKKQHLTNLKQELIHVQEEKEKANAQRMQEELSARTLLKKIALWKAGEQWKVACATQAKKSSDKKVRAYFEEQADCLSLEHAKQEIVPELIEQLTTELELFFSDKEQQAAHLTKAVAVMTKRTANGL